MKITITDEPTNPINDNSTIIYINEDKNDRSCGGGNVIRVHSVREAFELARTCATGGHIKEMSPSRMTHELLKFIEDSAQISTGQTYDVVWYKRGFNKEVPEQWQFTVENYYKIPAEEHERNEYIRLKKKFEGDL